MLKSRFGISNIAGIPSRPSSVSGINKTPSNISGLRKMPTANNPFKNVRIDRQRSAQIMNSSGENVIRNKVNSGNGGYNGN